MTNVAAFAWLERRRFVSGLLLLAALALYLPVFARWGSFHFDDFHSVVENPAVRTLSNIPRYFVNPQLWSAEPGNTMYRPLLLTTFAFDHALWGLDAQKWLFTSALIHGLCAVLVYRLALRLGLSSMASAFAGAVFVAHPALSEVQNYVASRSESLAALVMLGALNLHLAARDAVGRRRVALYASAWTLAAASVLAKETTAGFFLAVAVYEIVVPATPAQTRVVRAASAAVLYGTALALVLAVRRAALGTAVADLHYVKAEAGADPQTGWGRSVVDNLLTQSRVVVLYAKTLLWPVELNVDHAVRVTTSAEPSVVAAIALHASVAGAAIVSWIRGSRLFPLCVAWFWIFLAPSVVVPLNVVMNEHRLYLPMIAVALLAGAALGRVAELLTERWASPVRGALAAAAPLALFVPLVLQRSSEWRDDEILWSTAVARAPDSARAHLHLGAVRHEQALATADRAERLRLLDDALAEYAVSEAMHPGWSDLQLNLGNAWRWRGALSHDPADFERALAAFRRFGEIVGATQPRPRLLQAVALRELGRFDEAIALVRQVDASDATVTPIYDDFVARALRMQGRKDEATATMEKVVLLEAPEGRTEALLDLAWWSFEDGDHADAQARIQRALAIAEAHPKEFKAYLWAARFLVLTGKPKEAEEMFHLAKRHGWSSPEVEVRWIAGGPTPGVYKGTFGWRSAVPELAAAVRPSSRSP